MRELREKQQMKRRLYSWPSLILLIFITVLFLRGTYVVFQKKAESAAYVTSLSQKEEDLQKQQTELSANIEGLKTEEGLEKEVKAKYNVAKDGEHVVILVDENGNASDTEPENDSWIQKAWNAIMSAL
jgi:cell division protein FtsB